MIGEIRGELGHLQREVQHARKNHINVRHNYAAVVVVVVAAAVVVVVIAISDTIKPHGFPIGY